MVVEAGFCVYIPFQFLVSFRHGKRGSYENAKTVADLLLLVKELVDEQINKNIKVSVVPYFARDNK